MDNFPIGITETKKKDCDKKIAVIILANDEAPIIFRVIRSVQESIREGDTIFVVADNCTDDTLKQAAQTGACVRERSTGGPNGKGAALMWFVKEDEAILNQYQLVLILDADSSIAPDFLQQVRVGYISNSVMQCLVQPVGFISSPINTLIALSEIMEQQVLGRLRTKIHWPVRLRGTGMVMSPRILASVSNQLGTEVEDIVLSILIASMGVKIIQINQAYVFDPKPENVHFASRQRARWFRGQWKALWLYRRQVGKLLLTGPGGWSLVSSLFLKPRWIKDFVILIIGILFLFISPIISLICLFFLLFDISCVMYTILISKEKKEFLRAIIYFPAFMVMWMRSIILSFKKSSWLRARE